MSSPESVSGASLSLQNGDLMSAARKKPGGRRADDSGTKDDDVHINLSGRTGARNERSTDRSRAAPAVLGT